MFRLMRCYLIPVSVLDKPSATIKDIILFGCAIVPSVKMQIKFLLSFCSAQVPLNVPEYPLLY